MQENTTINSDERIAC